MTLNTNIVLVLLFCFVQLNSQELPKQLKKKAFEIGETISFKSNILDEVRSLNIYLPTNFSKEKNYPVIYLLDGSSDEDFIHISGLVQFGSFSWIEMIPESIVVGISNIDRKRDFTYPSTNKLDQKEFPTSGGSEQFIQFLQKEVQPLIASKYSNTTETTLIGQSLGGLLATEILIKHPNSFKNYIIISPSLWWDDENILNAPLSINNVAAVYIAVGKEGAIMERIARELHEKLAVVPRSKTKTYFQFFEKQNHGDAMHLAVYDAFEKIFKTPKKQ